MNKLLIDSSAWIDYFNATDTQISRFIRNVLNEEEYQICTCHIIRQEILQGIRDDRTFHHIKSIFNTMHILENNLQQVTNLAVEIYRILRKKGLTVRSGNDCLIASYALLNNCPLLEIDRDFKFISEYYPLRLIEVDP